MTTANMVSVEPFPQQTSLLPSNNPCFCRVGHQKVWAFAFGLARIALMFQAAAHLVLKFVLDISQAHQVMDPKEDLRDYLPYTIVVASATTPSGSLLFCLHPSQFWDAILTSSLVHGQDMYVLWARHRHDVGALILGQVCTQKHEAATHWLYIPAVSRVFIRYHTMFAMS